MYAISTGAHEMREYEVYESYQPWYRPIPVDEATYVGKLRDQPWFPRLNASMYDNDIWNLFSRNGIRHMQMWSAYHMISSEEVMGLDLYFRYWTPNAQPSTFWERYWLKDCSAQQMTVIATT